jgi:hypothetical protein
LELNTKTENACSSLHIVYKGFSFLLSFLSLQVEMFSYILDNNDNQESFKGKTLIKGNAEYTGVRRGKGCSHSFDAQRQKRELPGAHSHC